MHRADQLQEGCGNINEKKSIWLFLLFWVVDAGSAGYICSPVDGRRAHELAREGMMSISKRSRFFLLFLLNNEISDDCKVSFG